MFAEKPGPALKLSADKSYRSYLPSRLAPSPPVAALRLRVFSRLRHRTSICNPVCSVHIPLTLTSSLFLDLLLLLDRDTAAPVSVAPPELQVALDERLRVLIAIQLHQLG